MTDKSFEDQFDHDPNTVYEEDEEELDLGPDDEFIDVPKNASAKKKEREKRLAVPKGGCLFTLFKILLSLSLIFFCYFYLINPEKFKEIQTRLSEIISAEKNAQAPVLTLGEKKPETMNVPVSQKKKEQNKVPNVILQGSGVLPDFSTAAKQNPELNAYLISADKMTFNALNTYHGLVKNMIADWAEETDEQKISEIVQMPYKQFFNKTSASLLSQTVLKHAGLSPVNTNQLVTQSPVHVMAVVYPLLKSAMATKTTVQDQIRTIEPVSSFLIYICNGNTECMASWDLLIDMLGAKKFAKRLEKAPETIYIEK